MIEDKINSDNFRFSELFIEEDKAQAPVTENRGPKPKSVYRGTALMNSQRLRFEKIRLPEGVTLERNKEYILKGERDTDGWLNVEKIEEYGQKD